METISRKDLEEKLKEKEKALKNIEIIYLQLQGQVALLKDMLNKKDEKENNEKNG